jgi:hypothetical protein
MEWIEIAGAEKDFGEGKYTTRLTKAKEEVEKRISFK